MSLKWTASKDEVMEVALTNPLVLRCIFSSLKLKDLKQCRRVNKLWEFEAGSYIRDFRRCHVKISEPTACADLMALNQLISDMTFAPIINSLTMLVFCRPGEKCQCGELKACAELCKKLPLKYVDINEQGHSKCPMIEFIVSLLREKQKEFISMQINLSSNWNPSYFKGGWTPSLPKLKVLDVGFGFGFSQWKENVLKFISGAPNLQKLKGVFYTNDLKILPKAAYALLDNFALTIGSIEEDRKCLDLAEAGPALSVLLACAPSGSGQRYMTSYLHVLEQLLASSCKTLTEFTMGPELPPLRFLGCPPLINVTRLSIELVDSSDRLVGILRSINYPKMLPSLCSVTAGLRGLMDHLNPAIAINEWLNMDEVEPDVYPSKTVKHLTFPAEFNQQISEGLHQIYPELNKIHLDIGPMEVEGNEIHYEDLWAFASHLASISVGLGARAMRRNFDAEFLGIHPEEVEILRDFDDESVEKVQIVPIRPSILTMRGLRYLYFSFAPRAATVAGEPPVDQVFLSKLTGILAFKKMAMKGIKISFGLNSEIASRLNHLRPFTSFVVYNSP